MIPLFLALTAVNLLCLVATAALGYGAKSSAGPSADRFHEWHTLAGALTAIICCAVHCVAFTYFIATAKWVQHAVSVTRLDERLLAPTRSFRAQAFPAALAAMAVTICTAFFGAAADNFRGRYPAWHHGLALATLAVNIAAAGFEYSAIARNGRLIDRVLALVAAAGP